VIGVALGLVQTAATQTILGNAPVRMAGVAGGLQQTAIQVGGALGTSVLGAVISGRVAATFLGKLLALGVPATQAQTIAQYHDAVAQGVPPINAKMPLLLQAETVQASFYSFTQALDVAFVVAACIAFAAALIALLVRKGGTGEAGSSPL
jgi:hypothetical protein